MNKTVFSAIVILTVIGMSLSLRTFQKPMPVRDGSRLYMGHPASGCQQVGELIPDDTNCTVFYECDALLVPERFVCALQHTCFSRSANECDYTGCYVPC